MMNDEEFFELPEPTPWGQGNIGTLTDNGKETVKEQKERLLAAKKRMPFIGFYQNKDK